MKFLFKCNLSKCFVIFSGQKIQLIKKKKLIENSKIGIKKTDCIFNILVLKKILEEFLNCAYRSEKPWKEKEARSKVLINERLFCLLALFNWKM